MQHVQKGGKKVELKKFTEQLGASHNGLATSLNDPLGQAIRAGAEERRKSGRPITSASHQVMKIPHLMFQYFSSIFKVHKADYVGHAEKIRRSANGLLHLAQLLAPAKSMHII
uniref:Uncharacterized protein n=1 Tax=Solanum tuberosum TaxID=4113 RepID=M1DEJ2_SOLTU